MRRVSAPLDPRDSGPAGRGSQKVSEAAERARNQLRKEFEQLRSDIAEHQAAERSAREAAGGSRIGRKARASFAAFALTAAVAAAAANFALNGNQSSKQSGVSVPPASPEPEPNVISATPGGPQASSPPLLAAIPPSLLIDALGSGGAVAGGAAPGAASPFPGT